jgi:bifunctional DNA-binding transcriptional regulator/antitoxin component of YhaV-PrlF toxin-antitoxin module
MWEFPTTEEDLKMASTEATPMAGYTQLDGKGRLTLGKPIRDALHLEPGSTLAWLMVGDAVMLVPTDAHLAELMNAAATAFENAHLNLDNLDEELAHIREEVVKEHYGSDFFHNLRQTANAASEP